MSVPVLLGWANPLVFLEVEGPARTPTEGCGKVDELPTVALGCLAAASASPELQSWSGSVVRKTGLL